MPIMTNYAKKIYLHNLSKPRSDQPIAVVAGFLPRKSEILNSILSVHQHYLSNPCNNQHGSRPLQSRRGAHCRLLQYGEHGTGLTWHLKACRLDRR